MEYIPISQPSITEKEIAYVTDAVKSGWVSSLGKYIDIFEEQFAKFCGVKYAVAVSNGTVALHLALEAFGIKTGDEVIVPDLTFIATSNAVKYTGAKPIIVDILEDTLCIDPAAIENAITPKTRAIIPVHLYGHPADMEKINQIAIAHNLLVLEDAAEAHGAEINGRRVGGLGTAAAFSFYGNKIITSGEGGMVTTDKEELYVKMKFLRDHAMSKEKRYWHTEVGFNYRMTNLQAALGVAQLERIDELLQKRNQIFNWYSKYLSDIDAITLNYTADWAKSVYWMICIELKNTNANDRNILMDGLKKNGIDCRPYFYPMSDMPFMQEANTPVAHKKSRVGFNPPSYFEMTEEHVKYICLKIMELIK
jgi:perosamine synthetase